MAVQGRRGQGGRKRAGRTWRVAGMLGLALCANVACRSSDTARRSDVEALARDLRDQRERQAAMERRLADMDTRLAILAERTQRDAPRTADRAGRPAAPTDKDLGRPALGVVKVEPATPRKAPPRAAARKAEEQDPGAQDGDAVIELGADEMAALEQQGDGLTLPVDRQVLAHKAPEDASPADANDEPGGNLAAQEEQTLARTDPKTQYNLAMRLYRAKQYGNAARGFEEVADRWPDHPLADNAMYWTGVCYLSQGETALAINELQKVPVRYPKSDKVPDALFQLAEAYQRAGDLDSARAMLTQVVQMYPRAEAAAPARESLVRLNAR